MMNDSDADGQGAGLCGRCRHARVIENNRGSRFYLCQLSAIDSRFPKYPRLPIRRCAGFSPDSIEGRMHVIEPARLKEGVTTRDLPGEPDAGSSADAPA